MKKYFYKYTLFCLFLVFIFHLALAEINDESHFNFGRVVEGKKIEHTFTVFNDSNERKIIRKIKSSCGCTAVIPDEKEIMPKGKTTVKTILHTAGLKGKIEKKVELFLDNEEQPLTLYLSGQVINQPDRGPNPEISVSANPVNLGLLKRGEDKIFSVTIENRGKAQLNIRNFKIGREKDGLTLDKHPILPGKKIEASFSYHAGRTGPIEDYLLIVSNDPANPNLFVALTGEVQDIL